MSERSAEFGFLMDQQFCMFVNPFFLLSKSNKRLTFMPPASYEASSQHLKPLSLPFFTEYKVFHSPVVDISTHCWSFESERKQDHEVSKVLFGRLLCTRKMQLQLLKRDCTIVIPVPWPEAALPKYYVLPSKWLYSSLNKLKLYIWLLLPIQTLI